MALILPAGVNPKDIAGNRVTIQTWGIPTNVPTPGGQSNLPKPSVDLDGEVVLPPLSSYVAVAQGDTMAPVFIPGYIDRVVQVEGVAGGATVSIRGSNDGVNYEQMHDAFGNTLDLVAVGTIVQLMESTAWLQVALTGAPSGTTAISIILKARAAF